MALADESGITLRRQKAELVFKKNSDLRVMVKIGVLNGSLTVVRDSLLKENEALVTKF